MHYYEEHQERETKLTNDIVRIHQWTISEVLAIGHADKIFVEFDKKSYGAEGDVDIVVWKSPGLEDEFVIAVEVKVMFLNSEGNFKSKKNLSTTSKLKLSKKKDGTTYISSTLL